jgi:predicted TIM-barrel fold metal-dependent hydrolase
MYAHKHNRSSGARDQARDVLMRTMQAKQPALHEHSSQVAELAVAVARRFAMSSEELDEVARAAELGLRGINIQPSFFSMPIDHAQLYPVYAKASEHGLGVGVHTGVNYTSHLPIKHDHPLQLDQVACDFPELTLIACHAGWPWAAEMVAVARKHPNVYLEFGGLAPKYVGSAGTGWEVVFRFMNSLLSKQVLFGTDWPVFPMPRALEEWRTLGLKPAVLEALLGGNADRLLGRRETSPVPRRRS